MIARLGATGVAAFMAIAGCGGVNVGTGGSAAGGHGGASTSSAGGGHGGASTGGAGGGSVQIPCGETCSASEYCYHLDALCGAGVAGSCQPRPLDCSSAAVAMMCGCDGKVYEHPCAANTAGVDWGPTSGCQTPPGSFVCGGLYCSKTTQYCTYEVGDLSGHYCSTLPAACGAAPSCPCLASLPCTCATTSDGGLVATCSASSSTGGF